MGLELAKKALADQEISCAYTPVQTNLADLTKCLQQEMPNPADVIVWAMQAVSFGKWDGKTLQLVNAEIQTEDILALRIYNQTEELYLVRDGEQFTGRHVIDSEGKGQHVIDSFSRLWGETQAEQNVPAGFTCLRDQARGLELIVPYQGKKTKQLGLTTRNYIGYDTETGLAGYSDYRFVSIDAAKEG